MQDEYAVGLDLGTTFSCIGVYRKGGVEIIPNRNGERTTPSIVTIIDKNKILIGEETENNLVKDYDSSIYAIKRFIGRKYNDKDVINEINKENFPFKIIGDEEKKFAMVLVKKNNENIKYTLEEISSFIIRKMVDSAESYLGKKVNNLVITVPANFNDAQRNCTKQAAKLAGVNVLRIINEPTAAALAYGLGYNKAENNEEKNILVFDLGGGTFDVTILKINKGNKQIFETLSSKGDKFLGGEDFDNILVDYFLDKFCRKMNESKKKIREDKKVIRKLKIACENIKRVLSSNEETTLFISNFYNKNDIMEKITRDSFERLCEDLFERMTIPINEALIDAGLNKNEIEEIILVGGSSRIPKVKKLLQEYFNIDPLKKNITKKDSEDSKKTKINDSINPDETVAYGATLMAAKILSRQEDKDDNIVGFNLMDITPLSLGINVKNLSNNPEIQKEGHVMSVLIKRGTKIPCYNTRVYQTSADYTTEVIIDIYEGERKFVKYNHVLGQVCMSNLPKKKKGEVKIEVKFFIDVNGILSVTATEKSTGQSIETKIINDTVKLSDDDIEKIIEKNKNLRISTTSSSKDVNKKTDKDLDYSNLKETLKDFQDCYNDAENDDDKYEILKNYNAALEEFISIFDKDFDNETMVEKYFIYVKQLISSYIKVLNMKAQLTKGDEEYIINHIKEYIGIFTKQSSGYLDNLIEILKDANKKIFFEIVIITIEQLNNCGKECIKESKKFCKYYSLMYFEKARAFFKKYIGEFKALGICGKKTIEKCKKEIALSQDYITDINSNAILLCGDTLNIDKLIESKAETGFTVDALGLKISSKDEQEKYQIVLDKYENMLIDLSESVSEKKAVCIANIIKIATGFLGDCNYTKYYKLGETCEFIVSKLNIDKNKKWYKDFENIYKDIKENYILLKEREKEMRENMRKLNKDKFDEIDSEFTKKKSNIEFINYVLKTKPYPGYEEDKKNNVVDFSKESQELFKYLQSKYHPDNFTYSLTDEESQLNFCLIEYIEAYINNIVKNI